MENPAHHLPMFSHIPTSSIIITDTVYFKNLSVVWTEIELCVGLNSWTKICRRCQKSYPGRWANPSMLRYKINIAWLTTPLFPMSLCLPSKKILTHTNEGQRDKLGRFQKGGWRYFFNYLFSRYNVVDIVQINGRNLYSRQGTSFNTRLILISGRKLKPSGQIR